MEHRTMFNKEVYCNHRSLKSEIFYTISETEWTVYKMIEFSEQIQHNNEISFWIKKQSHWCSVSKKSE